MDGRLWVRSWGYSSQGLSHRSGRTVFWGLSLAVTTSPSEGRRGRVRSPRVEQQRVSGDRFHEVEEVVE